MHTSQRPQGLYAAYVPVMVASFVTSMIERAIAISPYKVRAFEPIECLSPALGLILSARGCVLFRSARRSQHRSRVVPLHLLMLMLRACVPKQMRRYHTPSCCVVPHDECGSGSEKHSRTLQNPDGETSTRTHLHTRAQMFVLSLSKCCQYFAPKSTRPRAQVGSGSVIYLICVLTYAGSGSVIYTFRAARCWCTAHIPH